MVSLDVYDRQYIGQGTQWVDTARRGGMLMPGAVCKHRCVH